MLPLVLAGAAQTGAQLFAAKRAGDRTVPHGGAVAGDVARLRYLLSQPALAELGRQKLMRALVNWGDCSGAGDPRSCLIHQGQYLQAAGDFGVALPAACFARGRGERARGCGSPTSSSSTPLTPTSPSPSPLPASLAPLQGFSDPSLPPQLQQLLMLLQLLSLLQQLQLRPQLAA